MGYIIPHALTPKKFIERFLVHNRMTVNEFAQLLALTNDEVKAILFGYRHSIGIAAINSKFNTNFDYVSISDSNKQKKNQPNLDKVMFKNLILQEEYINPELARKIKESCSTYQQAVELRKAYYRIKTTVGSSLNGNTVVRYIK